MKDGNFRKIGIFVVFIMIFTMILIPISNAQQFPDLRPDHWCYEKIQRYILWLFATNIEKWL